MLEIALTIDIDADVFDQSLQSASYHSQKPEWEGARQGIPLLANLFNTYTGSDQTPCIATWFVRADNQIGHYYGDNAYLLTEFQQHWHSLQKAGHEIAWHPHLYRLKDNSWIQETDAQALDMQMRASVEAARAKGWKITSSRIGEAYFSNAILKSLETLGITCDSTALPGRERKDETRQIDWLTSPRIPYYPSATDYRVPGTPHGNVLEVPFSMINVKADYDTVPLKRYIDLSFWHRALKDGLEQAIQPHTILNCIIHPSTVVPGLETKPHGLLSYRLEEVKQNIDFILNTAQQKQVPYCFTTISRLSKKIYHEQH